MPDTTRPDFSGLHFAPIVPFDWQREPFLWLDFSAGNPALSAEELQDTAALSRYLRELFGQAGVRAGVGGYAEHRVLYRYRPHFSQQAHPRELHLGLDLWLPAGTPVMAPLPGQLHSLADNAGYGNYGPTLVLSHTLPGGRPLFSLYGHLSRASLEQQLVGKTFGAGQVLGEIGPPPENGDWPPHLHFQLMTDLLGHYGDFPGVCSLPEKDFYLSICPDPAPLLGLVR